MPVRALLNRFALLLLILSAFAIMLLGKAETVAVERVRSGVVDVVAPVMDVLSRPIATLSAGVDSVENFFNVYQENDRLREQNARLLEWQSAALALAAENSTFRKMLNFVPERGAAFSAARIIGDSGGVFVRSVLINAGTASGIDRGDAVISGEGLVGRVAEAGHQSARVLLITDLNSRIPVVSEKSRVRAILSGDNSRAPKLAFLPPNAQLSLGDRIVGARAERSSDQARSERYTRQETPPQDHSKPPMVVQCRVRSVVVRVKGLLEKSMNAPGAPSREDYCI